MRKFVAVAILLAVIWLVQPGAIGGLMILVLPLLYLRGVWRFAGDIRRLGNNRL